MGTKMMRAAIAAICVAAALPSWATAKSVTLSCTGYTGTTTLTNFQALVKLTEGKGGLSYSDCEANGADLWFTDSAGTVIPHEVDTWNTSGDSFVWVRIPEVVPVAQGVTVFTMHWGDLAAKQTTSENVWKNNNDGKGGFAGVWHMNSAGGTATETDSTGNGLTGTPQGAHPETYMTSAVGVVGASRANRATDSALLLPAYSSTLTSPASFTISGWWNLSSWSDYPRAFQQANDKWQVNLYNVFGDTYIQGVVSGGISIGWNARTKNSAPRTASFVNNWMYLTTVFNGTTVEIYSNGSKRWTTTDVTANEAYEGGFRIGNGSALNRPWYGYYDEVRMYDGVQSADRVKADYDTMSAPDTFLTFLEARETTLRATGYTGTTTLANFQALVKMSEFAGGFSYSQCAANDGADLWFSDSAGNVIPHEVDTWNRFGDSFVWVRIPEVVPVVQGVTSITMHWGDLAARQTASENVWKNYNDGKGGFAGVWHMNSAGGTATETDSTGNGLTGTPQGAHPETVMTNAMGVVGASRANKATDSALLISAYSSTLTSPASFTISGWWNLSSWSDYPRAFQQANDKWQINLFNAFGDTYIQGVVSGGASTGWNASTKNSAPRTASFVNNWMYLTTVFNGTTVEIYSNGSKRWTMTDATANEAYEGGFRIGNGSALNRPWYGYYDEVRMYDGVQSADRVKADYDTMSAPDTFLAYTTIATWTGAANDGNGTNPQNWECSDNGVVVAGQLPNATYRIQSCTLSQDCDWSGLGTAYLATGAVVEMDGHSLTIPAVAGEGTVQNSAAGDAKELTITLASDSTNGDTAFTGNLKLVKTGDGVLTSSIAQSYSGGTEVRRGTIQAPQSTAAYNASFTPFGTGTITVNSNAVFNAQNTVAYRNNVILNGGTISGGAGDGGNRPVVMLERVTEDSAINQAVKAIDIGVAGTTTDLNGHAVSVSIAYSTYFRWYGSLEGVTGKIVASGEGYFTEFPVEARGIDLDVSSKIHFQNATHIHDYRAANSDYSGATGAGLGIYVSGTYTPVGNYYCGCVMEDGSTLNLSGRTGYFAVKSLLANSNDSALNTTAKKEARRTVQFASGATVTVNLAGRTDLKTIAESESNYIVKWDSTFGQPTTTTFRLDAETAQKFSLRSDATGLQLNKKKGFMLIVQ